MGGGSELHHQIVQCLKNVGFRRMRLLSCALPRIGGGVLQAKAVRSLCSWLRPQAISVSIAEVPARWGVRAVESEKLCKRRNKFSKSVIEQDLERELGKSGSPKQSQKS